MRSVSGQFTKKQDGEQFEGFTVFTDTCGYPYIVIGKKPISVHTFVWNKAFGAVPVGMHVHHKDTNKRNYDLNNLELITYSDHSKLHAGWVKTGDIWTHKPCSKCGSMLPLCEFYKRKDGRVSGYCKKCHCDQSVEWGKKNKESRAKSALAWYYRNKK